MEGPPGLPVDPVKSVTDRAGHAAMLRPAIGASPVFDSCEKEKV